MNKNKPLTKTTKQKLMGILNPILVIALIASLIIFWPLMIAIEVLIVIAIIVIAVILVFLTLCFKAIAAIYYLLIAKSTEEEPGEYSISQIREAGVEEALGKCPKCGYINPRDSKFCIKCGTPLEE